MTEPSQVDHPLLDAALAAVDRGWHVFPLLAGTKRPVITRWEQRCTHNANHVRSHWTVQPTHNVAIATGPSNLVVIDLDVPHDGQQPPEGLNMLGVADGADVLTELASLARQPIPPTYTVRTPSGGLHLYFQAPLGVSLRNTVGRLGWLIDTRAHGGYVVAAGSTTPAGAYELVDNRDPTDLPAWITRALTTPPPAAATQTTAGDRSKYLTAILDSEADKVRASQPGQHNETLFHAALTLGQLVGGHELDHAEACAVLQQAAAWLVTSSCGCTQHEVNATITSGLRLGTTKPRTL